MPSLQAKLVYFLAKHIWTKKNLLKQDLHSKRKRAKNFGEIFLSSQKVNTTTKKIHGITVEILTPTQKNNNVVLFIHGGGFVYDMTPFHYELINRLAIAAQVKIFAIHYSLAPENPFPKQIHEVKKIYQWLIEHGHKSHEIFFVGDSAGGNIAIATTLMLRDQKLFLPGGIIAISTPTDGTFSYPSFVNNQLTDIILTSQRMHFFIDSYRGKESTKNPLISPIFANVKGLPKIQLFVSDNELPFDDVIKFSEKLKLHKVVCELHIGKSLAHDYPLAARFIPEARESINLMAKFINNK